MEKGLPVTRKFLMIGYIETLSEYDSQSKFRRIYYPQRFVGEYLALRTDFWPPIYLKRDFITCGTPEKNLMCKWEKEWLKSKIS